MKIVMTGTREWRDADKIAAALRAVCNETEESPLILHFATNMVDGMVAAIAKLAGLNVVESAPNWREDSKAALFRLAERVIPTADLVVTFGEDKVTEHIAKVANDSNIRVLSVAASKPKVEVFEI
jgi:hypothetical protein